MMQAIRTDRPRTLITCLISSLAILFIGLGVVDILGGRVKSGAVSFFWAGIVVALLVRRQPVRDDATRWPQVKWAFIAGEVMLVMAGSLFRPSFENQWLIVPGVLALGFAGARAWIAGRPKTDSPLEASGGSASR